MSRTAPALAPSTRVCVVWRHLRRDLEMREREMEPEASPQRTPCVCGVRERWMMGDEEVVGAMILSGDLEDTSQTTTWPEE